MYVNNRTRRKWNQVLLFLVSCHFVKYSISSPIFSTQFSQFQSARNLRNLPCVVRKSGLKGVCMFAIDCIKSNGTHLGTCIDKFYFGSCCQVKDIDSIYSPDLDDNRIDSNYPSPSSYDKNSHASTESSTSHQTPSSSSSAHFSPSNYKTTSLKPAINYNNKTFELITTTAPSLSSTSKKEGGLATKRPASVNRRTTTTEKYLVNAGGFSTTLGNIIERNTSTSIKLRDESSTTESIKLTTFQSIQESIKNKTTSPSKVTSAPITVQKVKPTKQTSVTKKPVSNRTSVSTESSTITVRPSRRPTATPKPSKNATSTVIKTTSSTKKPVGTTTIAVNRRTTISSRRNATSTRKPATRQPTITTTKTPSAEQLTTISYVETTRAPRPKPKPTSEIIKVDSSTIASTSKNEDSAFTTSFSVISANGEKKSTTALPSSSSSSDLPLTTESMINTSTVKSTLVTRKPSNKPATSTKATTTTSTVSPASSKRPIIITESTMPSTQSSTFNVEDEIVTSSKINFTSTSQKAPLDETLEITTSGSGLVTWTLGNDVTDNVTKDDAWILLTSVKPHESHNASSIMETILENRVTPITQFTLTSENLTQAIITENEDEKITKIEESTIEVGLGSDETSSENYISITSETTLPTSSLSSSSESIEEEEMQITTVETKPIETGEVEEEEGEVEEEEEEEEMTTISEMLTTPAPISSSSSSTPLPTNETMPISLPDDMTVTPLVSEVPQTTTISSLDTDKFHSNATSSTTMSSAVPSSTTHMSLEGVDYRQICGRRMFPEARIVGGAKSTFGRWPWQISLRQWRTSTYLHKCGSALLNENWAISAAHCVDNVPPSDLLLRLGEYDLSIEEEPYGYQERRVQIVASHPQFDPRTFEYDLALLRFYEPVVFQPNIIPVCVPENDEDFIGRTAYVTGWGRLYEDGPLPSVLQEVTVPVIKNDICEAMYRNAGYIEHIPHIFICAGWQKGGHDSCEGDDSGGPMVIQRTDKRFQLAGIISWGIGCAEPNQPGVYTRISEFRDWINQILMF